MTDPRPSQPPANFPTPQTESGREMPGNPGPVIRVPRAVAFLALALLIIGFPLLCVALVGGLSGTSLWYFFGGLLSFSAGMTAVLLVAVVRKARAVGRWATATATVIQSEAVWGLTTHGGRTAGTWLARFSYQYEVGGRVYRGGRIAFYRRCTGSRARQLVARHPAGSRVRVYYDPARPAEAVLDRSFPGLWWLPFFAAALAALAVVFFKLPALLAR
jgi:nitrate reductase NapE component